MFIYILWSYLYLCQGKNKNYIHLTMDEILCGHIILYMWVFNPHKEYLLRLTILNKNNIPHSNKNCFLLATPYFNNYFEQLC